MRRTNCYVGGTLNMNKDSVEDGNLTCSLSRLFACRPCISVAFFTLLQWKYLQRGSVYCCTRNDELSSHV